MAEALNLKIKGLFTSFNEFSEVPEGALIRADNIDIIQDSIAQPRRGFDREVAGFSDPNDRADALVEYQNKKIAHHGDTVGAADTLSYYTGSAWTQLESVSAITSRRMKFVGANQNLYYTTNAGIKVLDVYNGTPRYAGSYKGLDLTASTSATNASFFAANGDAVAYRALWIYKDTNKNYIFGAPSQREVFVATTYTKGVDVVTTIPSGVTTAWTLQLYRSKVLAKASVDVGGVPSDEMYLAYEVNPDSSAISAKSITITDIVPESLLGATIYTATSQEGISAANEIPPMAEDIAYFDNCVFAFNTTSKHRLYLTLISVGGSAGIAANDTIGIGGVTYTGKASETASSGEFKVFSGGSYSAAQLISETAKSLVRVINQYSSSTVYAYYLSGPDDLPGLILLEERAIGGAAFSIVSSKSTCWNPTNIPTSGTTVQSSNDAAPNKLHWSKPNQPEAFPLTNTAFVGSKNDDGLRCKALRDALYLFKASGEVYKLTGKYPNYQIDKIEDSVKLIARESLSVLNNQLYCLSDQGATVISDSTKIISRPIEQDLLSLVNQNYSLVSSITFGVAYESDRKYYLFLPSASGDTSPTQAYVYNIFTNTWVRHTLNATCGLVDINNNFYLADSGSNYLKKERKNYSFLDYADFSFATSITSIDDGVITLDSGIDLVSVGDLLYQSSSLFAQISSIDLAAQTLTIDSDPGLTEASVTILKGIPVEMTWAPITLSRPGVLKQFHTASFLFKSDFLGSADLTFLSDLSQSVETVPLTGRGLSLYGLFPWGEEPWGGDTNKRPVRQLIPRNKQRASQLTVGFTHNWAYSNWILEGIAIFGEFGSEKVGRD